jgi:NitT/TauT family transport system ATP-binding protein
MITVTVPAVVSRPPNPGGRDIDVSAVSKVFQARDGGRTNALTNTSFKIRPGAFVSLVGPSGCGKSTLLRMIAGLIPPTRGAVLLGGAVVSKPLPEIGIAFQRPVLLPWLTVRGNIALPAELDGRQSKADIAAKVDALLEMVRLPGSGARMPGELSGGMQQRVAIARALMSDPGVLLMDEPFGALDAMTREHLNDELLEIWARDQPTVVFVTHDIPEAVYLSDRVLVMAANPGRVIADIAVPLPRPRDAMTRLHPEFARLGADIRALIAH